MRPALLSLILLATFGAAAAGQRTEPSRLSLPDRIGPATRDTLQRLVDSTRAVGLPSEPLAAKAAEGVLKGADDARILRAVRSLVRELDAARQAMPGNASPSALAAAASAIHASARLADVRSVAAAARDDAELNLSLVTLADLVANGVPSSAAAGSIEQLVKSGVRSAELLAFRSAVVRDIERGLAPEQAVRARTRLLTPPPVP